MPEVVRQSIAVERALAILSAFFGALSLLLAAVGLYGVTSYAVSRRRSEIGIRMALGATRAECCERCCRACCWSSGQALLTGVGVSLWASQFLGALLHGVEPRDPLTLIGAIMVLTAVGALAGFLPAWRAARVDPMVALRCE